MHPRVPSIVLAITLLAGTARAEGFWRRAPVLPAPRQEVAVAALDGFVYVVGGIGTGFVSNAVERYDPATERWESVAPLPEPLHHSAATALGGFIYVFGGYRTLSFDATDAAYRYDPARNLWSPIARLPQPRAAHAAVAIGSTMYVVGGARHRGHDLDAYDAGSDSWSPRAAMPTAREHLGGSRWSDLRRRRPRRGESDDGDIRSIRCGTRRVEGAPDDAHGQEWYRRSGSCITGLRLRRRRKHGERDGHVR